MADPNSPPAADAPPSDPPAADPPVTPEPTAAAPAAPAQAPTAGEAPQTPAPEETPTELTDEQVIQAMRDPRAQAILQYAYTQAGVSAPAPATPAPETPTPPSSDGDGDFLSRMAKLAEEGDVDAIQTATAAEAQRRKVSADVAAESKKAVDASRRQMLGGLAGAEELQNLNANQQLRLMTALQQGDTDFIREAGKIIAENQRGNSQEASAATATAVGNAQTPPATPDLPGATPIVGGPPIPEGEEAKTKDGYAVLKEFFDFEDNENSLTPT